MHIYPAHSDVTVLGDHLEVPGLGFLPVNAFVIQRRAAGRGWQHQAQGWA